MNFRRILRKIRCLLAWAFGPRNLMKNLWGSQSWLPPAFSRRVRQGVFRLCPRFAPGASRPMLRRISKTVKRATFLDNPTRKCYNLHQRCQHGRLHSTSLLPLSGKAPRLEIPIPCRVTVVSRVPLSRIRGSDATMTSTPSRLAGHLLVLSITVASTLPAQTAPAASTDFFESKIRPVLANNCYYCHTNSQLGGLRLDSRDGMLKGGKSRPVDRPRRSGKQPADPRYPPDRRQAEDAAWAASSRIPRSKISSPG